LGLSLQTDERGVRMANRAENLDPARVLGYLGADNVLYCSPTCAAEAGQKGAAAVDQDEYQALMDGGSVVPSAACPRCGSEYPLDWRGEDER
jgi:hypothetical protein